MTEAATTLAGVALMYLFDPDRGEKRRATVRDKAVFLAGKTSGIAARTRARVSRRFGTKPTPMWRRPAARWLVGGAAALGLAAYGWRRAR